MHVRTVYHRQYFDMVRPHALKRQIKPLVGVDVWKNQRIHQLAELLIRRFRRLSLQPRKVDHAIPVNAPITSAKTRKTCSSRCRSSATRSNSQDLHALVLVVWALSLIVEDYFLKAHRTGFEGRPETEPPSP
jgi:hypothetical protein